MARSFHLRSIKFKNGFSFIEIMVATIILTAGIVSIYQAYFVSLDYMNHVTHRMVAMRLLDKRIADMELLLRSKGAITLAAGSETKSVVIHHKKVEFHFETSYHNVDSLKGLYQVDLVLSWSDGARNIRIGRTVYISS